MKLYYMAGACPLAAHIVLEWAGAHYETEKLSRDDLKKEAYLRINPLGAVPALEVDGSVITQNGGVLTYLAEAYPDARLGGDGTPRGDAGCIAGWASSIPMFIPRSNRCSARPPIWRTRPPSKRPRPIPDACCGACSNSSMRN